MIKKIFILLVLLASAAWAEATLTLSQNFTPSNGAITDGNPVGVMFRGTFDQANPLDQVLGATVSLTLTGGYNANLYAYLIAPNGTLVVLMDRPGVAVNGLGAYGSGMNITLSDAAGTSIQSVTTGDDNFTGTFHADGNLLDFNSSLINPSLANGDWTLYFADLSSGGGQSMLNGWTLNLTVVPEPVELALGLFAAMLLALAVLKRVWPSVSK